MEGAGEAAIGAQAVGVGAQWEAADSPATAARCGAQLGPGAASHG